MKGLIAWYESVTGTKVSGTKTKRYMGEYTEEEIEELNDEVKLEVLQDIGMV